MKDNVTSLLAWALVEFMFYIIFAFIAGMLNFIEWHVLWRFLYAVVFVIISFIAFDKFSK